MFGYCIKLPIFWLKPRFLQVFLACILACCQVASAAPLIADPKFNQLSTTQGLSQDSVNDLLIDRDGFLWVATSAGLNRFDGYRVSQFENDMFHMADMSVQILFEDPKGHIWVGSTRSGLFYIDIDKNSIELVKTFKSNAINKWSDRIVDIGLYNQEQLMVTTVDQVVLVNINDFTITELFELAPELQTPGSAIRAAIPFEDSLLIARADTLEIWSSEDGVTGTISLSQSEQKNAINLLFQSHDKSFWVGTEQGLYHADVNDLRRGEIKQRVKQLRVTDIYETDVGSLYIATRNGLYSFNGSSEQLQHFFRATDSRLYLSSDDILSIERDKRGNIWLGTRFDGALYWSTQSIKFENVRRNESDEAQLSSNSILSFTQLDSESLWVGTADGLNRYDLDEHEISGAWLTYDTVGAGLSRIRHLAAFNQRLFVNTSRGLFEFDVETKQRKPLNTQKPHSAALLKGQVKSVLAGPLDSLWLSTSEGFYQYHIPSATLERLDYLSDTVSPQRALGFIQVSNVHSNVVWISDQERVWAYNVESQTLQTVHQLERDTLGEAVYPESVLQDAKQTLWIAYPGAGLVGLDATTYTEKFSYSKKDILPSNMIYGLHQDNAGSIWMSSHAGLLKFNSEGPFIQQYGIAQGLDGKEFNGLAHLVMKSEQYVYGSQKGFTIFDPVDFESNKGSLPEVVITSVKLSSKTLQMPLTNLSGQVIELEHYDAGLTIEFSTLAFEHQRSTQYKYRLEGANSFDYPPTTDSQVTFPRLDPGNYLFTAVAYDPISGLESKPASVQIVVNYALWLSPQAYALYIFVFVSIVLFWWYRRDVQNKQVLLAHAEALESQNRLSLALTASNSNIWEWRANTNRIYAPRIIDELGYREYGKEIDFLQHLNLIHHDDRHLFEANWNDFIKNPQVALDITYRLKAKDGAYLWYRDVGSVVVDTSEPDEIVITGTYSNITESVADREKMRLFGEAFKHTRDWVVVFTTDMRPVAVNSAFIDAFGIDDSQDLNRQLKRIFEEDVDYPPRFWKKLADLSRINHWKGEDQLQTQKGRECNVLINMTSIASTRADGEVDYFLVIMSDISEQKEAENELRRLANYDSLTGLPNRTLLLDRINHGIDHADRHKQRMAVFFIDLDRFKQVNDSLGHKAGDQLLQIVAQRLTNLLRKDDTVARLGGDEFVVMVEQVNDPERLSVLAKELIEVLEESIQLGNQTVSVSSSVGIAIYPGDAVNAEELLRNADLAMYHAKEQGRSNFQYFTEHMNHKAQQRLLMENRLKKAHQSKVFINYYQPIVNITSGLVEGFELLMRWPDDEGMVPPDQFIPIAEELGLIENMTWDALERAMPVLSEWQSRDREVYLSVNLSARHFERQISIDHIVLLLAQHNLPVSSLRFEITESALMRDYERALEYMESMQEQGFIIALDDFGTGYSSLKYLKEFPIQVLKVDKSFVDDIGKNKSNEALVLTTLRMAESLGMYCVAEGIEEPHQITFFKRHGCHYLQGYYYSRPVPAEATAELIEQSWLTKPPEQEE